MKLLSFSFLFTMLFSCQNNALEVESLTPLEGEGMVRNDFGVIIDLREKGELASGLAKPAKWFAMSKIVGGDSQWESFISDHPKDKTLIFYCAKGGRAQKIAEKYSKMGYKTANMGGFNDWVNGKLPVKPAP
jgi:rhodanese-related sulfurtransferase